MDKRGGEVDVVEIGSFSCYGKWYSLQSTRHPDLEPERPPSARSLVDLTQSGAKDPLAAPWPSF